MRGRQGSGSSAAGVGVAGRGGGGGGGVCGRVVGGSGLLVKEDAALDGLAADGALAHSVAAQLAGAVAAQEDHVLQPVQAHRAHGLFLDVLELLLQLLHVSVDVGVVFVPLQGRDVSAGPT